MRKSRMCWRQRGKQLRTAADVEMRGHQEDDIAFEQWLQATGALVRCATQRPAGTRVSGQAMLQPWSGHIVSLYLGFHAGCCGSNIWVCVVGVSGVCRQECAVNRCKTTCTECSLQYASRMSVVSCLRGVRACEWASRVSALSTSISARGCQSLLNMRVGLPFVCLHRNGCWTMLVWAAYSS